MPIDRRRFITTSGALTTGILAGCLGDQEQAAPTTDSDEADSGGDEANTQENEKSEYPSEDVRLIIPTNPGGGYDFYSRLVAKYINQKEYLGTKVKPENVPGEATIVGANELYRSNSDGYTNGIINPDIECKAPFLPQYKDVVKFDPREFTFYPRVAGTTLSLAVSPDSGIENLSDLIGAIQDESVKFGIKNLTGTATMALISLGRVSGRYDLDKILDNVVQYDGTGPIMSGMKRGEVQVTGGSYSSLLQYHESDDVNIITVYTLKDQPPNPDITPNAETLKTTEVDLKDAQGVISLAGGTYHRVFAGPPDIPQDRAEKFRTAIRKAIKDPDLQAEASENKRPINFLNSEETKKGVVKMYEVWKENQDLLEKLSE